MAGDDLVELKFRLYDGTDIGPTNYPPATTVANLKESILAQWPSEVGSQCSQVFSIFLPLEISGGIVNRYLNWLASQQCVVLDKKKENGPKTISDMKLINAGKVLENNKTLAESRVPVGELPGGVITMHVVVRPPSSDKASDKQLSDNPKTNKCACTIL